MATQTPIVLVTGCSVGGIGFELAAQLLAKSYHVLLGIRSPSKGDAAKTALDARSLPGEYDILDLDVSSESSISTAAEAVRQKYGRLDALVNNAAVAGSGQSVREESLEDEFATCFRTNATGPYLMVEAFADLLKKSTTVPRIINISSGAGSIRRILDPNSPNFHQHREMGMSGLGYGASKAAMNLITAKQAVVYGGDGFKVFAYSPGFVVSNLSHRNKAEKGARATAEAVMPIIKVLEGERDEEHGCFLGATGQYEW